MDMSVLEKTVEVGKELFEVNGSSLRKFAEQESVNFKKYVELNQGFFKKIPELREVSAYIELQRGYNKSLWTGVQSAFRTRGEMVREAVEQSGNIIRGAFDAGSVAKKATKTVKKTTKAAATKAKTAATKAKTTARKTTKKVADKVEEAAA
jgi:hypothetical protein